MDEGSHKQTLPGSPIARCGIPQKARKFAVSIAIAIVTGNTFPRA
jgi:hypothetical protein